MAGCVAFLRPDIYPTSKVCKPSTMCLVMRDPACAFISSCGRNMCAAVREAYLDSSDELLSLQIPQHRALVARQVVDVPAVQRVLLLTRRLYLGPCCLLSLSCSRSEQPSLSTPSNVILCSTAMTSAGLASLCDIRVSFKGTTSFNSFTPILVSDTTPQMFVTSPQLS